MRSPLSIVVTLLGCLFGTLAAYLTMMAFDMRISSLMFVVGAIVGSQAAAFRIYKATKTARPPLSEKLIAGLVLAVTNGAVGLVLHLTVQPFAYADIVIPIAAAGSLVFPFAIVNIMTGAFDRAETGKTQGNG